MILRDNIRQTNTARLESYENMLEATQRLIDALDHNERTTLKERTESGKYKNLDIYVTAQIAEMWRNGVKYDEQVTRLEIKIYKKGKILAARTVDCINNKIIPWIGGKEVEWLGKSN